jgi:transposase
MVADADKKPAYEDLEAAVRRLTKENADLKRQLKKVLGELEKANRAPKRQAAPFSKGKPKKKPKKPGRKPGKGKWCNRQPPEEVDETLETRLPADCPCCGGVVEETEIADQYQTDLPPVRPVTRRFRIHIGRCGSCGKRVQGRHELQTSDALGAAHAALLNKAYGLSWGKISALFGRAFQLNVTRGALCRATVERLGPGLEPVYEGLVEEVANSSAVGADETSWKVAGQLQWLWIFTTVLTTVYKIAPSRGWDVIKDVLGEEFDGACCRDGWAPYGRLEHATHQTCLAHLFKRIADILDVAERGAARFPRKVRRVLKKALALRDNRQCYTEHGFASLLGKVRAELDRALAWRPTYPPNRRFAKHLRKERKALLTFLENPMVDATNWRSEQGLRPAVVNRKVSGGNRSERGARAQAVLTSIIRTCAQRGRDALDFFVRLLRGEPVDLSLAAGPSP